MLFLPVLGRFDHGKGGIRAGNNRAAGRLFEGERAIATADVEHASTTGVAGEFEDQVPFQSLGGHPKR